MPEEKLLVLMAGQSNMAGRGYATPEDLTEIPGLVMIRPDLKWQSAIEPVHKDRPFIGTFAADGTKILSDDPFETVLPADGQRVTGVGMGRTFGRLLLEANPGATVGLVPCAVGGVSVDAWLPGGVDDHDAKNHPYDDALVRAREAQKTGRIVAILWHQGENEASRRNVVGYKAKLHAVVDNFHNDLNLGPDVPFIAGDLASFLDDRFDTTMVDNALAELAAEDPRVRLVTTKDMTHRGDFLHFDTPSLHALGARYFAAYQDYMTAFSEK